MLGTSVPWDTQFDVKTSSDLKRTTTLSRRSALAMHQASPYRDKTDAQTSTEPSFYSDEIDRFAAMEQQPVTLQRLLQICEPPLTREKLLENAQYLCRERPVRYAKRVKLFQQLPFIVNLNPHINAVYQSYYANFEESRRFACVETLTDERQFIKMLAHQSKLLRDIMPQIARGFYECRNYFKPDERRRFLDQLIKMRIGLRLLTSQHIALYDQYQAATTDRAASASASASAAPLAPITTSLVSARPNDSDSDETRHQGIIDNRLHLADMVHVCAQSVQAMCDMSFGDSPTFVVDGQTDIVFRYIPSHLDYMLTELLKNAFRASLKCVEGTDRAIPPVFITISKGDNRVAIRIRDCGGGIPSQIHEQVFDYSFTTTTHGSIDEDAGGASTDGSAHPVDTHAISGLGFGLPMTKIYAEYFGGMLNIISLEDYGCDAFLELPSIKLNRTPTIQI
ncbi:hypothetical protein IWW50_001611 [Coemansia erecta]|nr:hypothetical protein IWW50_001611 [Coemansia erecta]